jgi:energy-coupling factor transporter ATP-binding protein EcfA2
MGKATIPDTPHDADRHDLIRVHGARVNNLKDISVELPKRRLTVFTGVSGSGKSSLVFGTIAAESQRMINETYSTFVQGFMPTLARPDVDVLDGPDDGDHRRPAADGGRRPVHGRHRHRRQRDAAHPLQPPGAAAHRLVAGVLVQRRLVSGAGAVTLERAGKTVKEKRSFTITGGMCPRCEGRGSVTDIDLTQLYDDSKSLAEGAFTIPGWKSDSFWTVRVYAESGLLDPDKPIRRYTKKELAGLPLQGADQGEGRGGQPHLRGLIPKVQKSFLSKDPESLQPHIRAFVDRAVTFTACPRVRRHPAQRGGPLVEDRRDQHRRRLRDADQRPRRVGPRASTSRRWRRCWPRCSRRSTPSWRSGSATCRSTGRRARCRAARRSARR